MRCCAATRSYGGDADGRSDSDALRQRTDPAELRKSLGALSDAMLRLNSPALRGASAAEVLHLRDTAFETAKWLELPARCDVAQQLARTERRKRREGRIYLRTFFMNSAISGMPPWNTR